MLDISLGCSFFCSSGKKREKVRECWWEKVVEVYVLHPIVSFIGLRICQLGSHQKKMSRGVLRLFRRDWNCSCHAGNRLTSTYIHMYLEVPPIS